MMTELSEIQAELSGCFEELFKLGHIFTLALNQFPDEPEEIWQEQTVWILSLLASEIERNADLIRGQTYALDQLQQTLSSEVSQ